MTHALPDLNEVKFLVRNALDLDWRAHGIGFMKTYLDSDKTVRLNLYHKSLRNPGISTMHDHPWALHSRIMAGRLSNTRMVHLPEAPTPEQVQRAFTMQMGVINCADFKGLEADPTTVRLIACETEFYHPGEEYSQSPDEIHDTDCEDGTVTVLTRGAPSVDGTARVFWPVGEAWGDASRSIGREDVVRVSNAAYDALCEAERG